MRDAARHLAPYLSTHSAPPPASYRRTNTPSAKRPGVSQGPYSERADTRGARRVRWVRVPTAWMRMPMSSPHDDALILCYDGSAGANHAIQLAGSLFPGEEAL